ncbi:MAG: hypothetical protein IKD43_00860 [Clostridia bacterium]|nr:hypothetical protein [Clostridia bacterium]
MKGFLAKKNFGFYVTLGVALLAIVTALVYYLNYANLQRFLSWPAVWVLVGGAVGALLLSIVHLDELGTALLAVCSLVALLLFIKIIYNYVVVVLVGIDLNTFDAAFLSSTVLLVLTFIGSLVNVFLPQKKAQEDK